MIRQTFICDCGCQGHFDLDDYSSKQRGAEKTLRLTDAEGRRYEFMEVACLKRFLEKYEELSYEGKRSKMSDILPGQN